ncbi:hypothetical protein Hanom_Chr10g00908481 [Helianthus anomalus]
MLRTRFCELTWLNVREWFNIFTSSIFFPFDRFVTTHGILNRINYYFLYFTSHSNFLN